MKDRGTFGPAYALPMFIQFLRPTATGRIEFRAFEGIPTCASLVSLGLQVPYSPPSHTNLAAMISTHWESYGAGLYVKNLTHISIERVQAHAGQNGIMIARSIHATEGKTYSAGCDSSGILLMEGSNRNRIFGNSFTHSEDGFFLSRSAVRNPSNFNYVAFNDGSSSFHFEAVFTAGKSVFP